MLTHTAFVIGNGTSRETINLKQLKKHGITYGCNAVYRHFRPHHLIAVDSKMILEIAGKQYQMENKVWTNPTRANKNIKGINFINPNKGWSSGPTALWLASQENYKEIYILGFDFQGIGEKNSQFNNIYADTYNYKKSDEPATYYGNWLRQTVTTIKSAPTTRFIRVIQPDNFRPTELNKIRNISNITVDDFKKQYNLS